jgi:transposase-like protein
MAVTDIDQIGSLLHEAFVGRDGLRQLLEAVVNAGMREETALHVGAAEHQRSKNRLGYRNGSKPRTLKTRVGELQLSVPQVRDCEPYHPSMFARWQRSERALLVACGEMYFQGVSTRNVQNVLQEMCGLQLSSATVSRVAVELDEKLSVFADRRLDHTAWSYLMLDARYEKVRVGDKVISQAVLVTVGFTVQGKREVLDWRVADSESEESWGEVFRSLKDRGLGSVELVVSDAHSGIRAAISRHLAGRVLAKVRGALQAGDGQEGRVQEAQGTQRGPADRVQARAEKRMHPASPGDGGQVGEDLPRGGSDASRKH